MQRSSKARSSIPIIGAFLYLTLVMISTSAMAMADWADHLDLIPLVGFFGGIVGIALVRSYFRGRLAFLMSSAYGFLVIFWLIGQTLDPAFSFRERLLVLLRRFSSFLLLFIQGVENQDPLMVVLLMAFVFWGFSVYGAWVLFRRESPWGAVLPLGLILLVNTYYYFGRARLDVMLALYVLFSLLTILYHEVRQQDREWRSIRSRVSSNTLVVVARFGAAIALVLVTLSWAGPAFAESEAAERAWTAVSGPWRFTRDRISKALYSLRSPTRFPGDEFTNLLTLEAGIEPTDDMVMEVSPDQQIVGPGRFYWRARVYDTYQGGTWQYSSTDTEQFDPREGNLALPEYEAREQIVVEVAPRTPVQSSLFVPGQTVWVDRTTNLKVEKFEGRIVDVSAFVSNRPVYRGEIYKLHSQVAIPRAEQLRQAGQDYPEWVRAKYLQVPESVTDRTEELAQEIAGEIPNPYDKAVAVTAWMRENIDYRRVTLAPPEGREPIDWFLFDYGIGFCNYYASAEVIMLRSLGVPARLAVGYARGDYDARTEAFTVTAREYHAWPEVFFPDYGWVEFEPTVSQPELIRPEPDTPEGEAATENLGELRESGLGTDEFTPLEDQADLDADGPATEQNRSPFIIALLGVVLTMGLGFFVWTRLDAGWRLTLNLTLGWLPTLGVGGEGPPDRFTVDASDSELELAYYRWLAWWPRLGLFTSPDQTPTERASLFSAAYPDLAKYSDEIAAGYNSYRFGQEANDQDWKAIWRQLRQRLLQAYLNRAWQQVWDLYEKFEIVVLRRKPMSTHFEIDSR